MIWINQYWTHTPDGESYAVQIDEAGQVVSACGPIDHTERTQENLDGALGWNFNDDPETTEWIDDHQDEFVLGTPWPAAD